jgi:hypothetical protein
MGNRPATISYQCAHIRAICRWLEPLYEGPTGLAGTCLLLQFAWWRTAKACNSKWPPRKSEPAPIKCRSRVVFPELGLVDEIEFFETGQVRAEDLHVREVVHDQILLRESRFVSIQEQLNFIWRSWRSWSVAASNERSDCNRRRIDRGFAKRSSVGR